MERLTSGITRKSHSAPTPHSTLPGWRPLGDRRSGSLPSAFRPLWSARHSVRSHICPGDRVRGSGRRLATRFRTGREVPKNRLRLVHGDQGIAEGIRSSCDPRPYAGPSVGCDRRWRQACGHRCAVRPTERKNCAAGNLPLRIFTTRPGWMLHGTRCNGSGRSPPSRLISATTPRS